MMDETTGNQIISVIDNTEDVTVAVAPWEVDKQGSVKVLHGLLVGIILLGSSVPAYADCMRDRYGRVVCDRGQCVRDSHGVVYCSRYQDGSAIRNRYGKVVCGKGECVRTSKGDFICSARPGGAAMKDLYGSVMCEGGCEDASAKLCGQGLSTSR